MILLKTYLIVLEIQLVLQIITWLACNVVVTSARAEKCTTLTEYCYMVLTIAKISPEECVRTVDDVKFNLTALVSALLWPITLPIGIWCYIHD